MLEGPVLKNVAVTEESFYGGVFLYAKGDVYMQADPLSFHEHR